MSALVPLHFGDADVRMVMLDSEPWWVGADIVAMLGIRDRYQALDSLDEYERGRYIVPTPSGGQEMIVVNESGVYSLLFRSRKPVALDFKRWLTCEVIPAIRKYGFYDPARLAQLRNQVTREVPQCLTGRGARLLDEVRSFEEREGRPATVIAGLSINKLRAIELGGDVAKTLGRGNLWLFLLSAGFDLFYILFGERRSTANDALALAQIRQEVRLLG